MNHYRISLVNLKTRQIVTTWEGLARGWGVAALHTVNQAAIGLPDQLALKDRLYHHNRQHPLSQPYGFAIDATPLRVV